MHQYPPLISLRQRSQRGVSLIFALLGMVAMALAALALTRSVDTSATLLGNIGFKQDATASADQATRVAVDWLTLNKASLAADIPTSGYYASTAESGGGAPVPVDATGQLISSNLRQLIDWDSDGCAAAAPGSYNGCSLLSASAGNINGNAARFAVFRLCSKPGDPFADDTIQCAQRPSTAKACKGSKGAMAYGDMRLSCPKPSAYYRVVVRVLGARNTASFTETIVHF
jgi:type IV pilus assembly protein PilX